MEATLVDLGIPTQSNLVRFFFGTIRKPSTLSKLEYVFLIGSVLALLTVCGLTIEKLTSVSKTSSDFTFAFIILLNACFCIFYSIYGVLAERPFKILILLVATVVLLLYLILNYAFSIKGPVKLARLIVAAICGPVLIVMSAWLARKYYVENHLIFRLVGADSGLQKMCKLLYFFYDFLKFDLQLALTIVIFVLAFETDKVPTAELVILIVGIVLAIAHFILGTIAVMKESKILSWIFLPLSLVSPAYVIYRMEKSAEYINDSGASSITGSVLTCAILALICRGILLCSFVMVFRNYGNGLKEKVFATEKTNSGGRNVDPGENA